jgi:hypothetical protein
MRDARQDRFAEVLGQDGAEVIDASGLCNSHGLFLRGPKERKLDPFGQGFGSELGRLVTCNYRLDNFRSQERQPEQSSDVAICDSMRTRKVKAAM